jgi:hypothetical protein
MERIFTQKVDFLQILIENQPKGVISMLNRVYLIVDISLWIQYNV